MKIQELIASALKEDLNELGDISSQAIFTTEQDSFTLYAKENGIVCGRELWEAVFSQVDPSVKVTFLHADGDSISSGEEVARIQGKVLSILTAERTAINFLSYLSGIATKAGKYAAEAGDRAIILDTRKTLPGYRELAKYAVRCGGAQNHRQGLYDMVMIKDNHADAAGGITEAVSRVRALWKDRFPIEVEARSLEEVREALACRVSRIMLDNMDCETMKQAAAIVDGDAEVEASGNMTLERIAEVSRTGVDFISVGDLTHSVKAFDFSLLRAR